MDDDEHGARLMKIDRDDAGCANSRRWMLYLTAANPRNIEFQTDVGKAASVVRVLMTGGSKSRAKRHCPPGTVHVGAGLSVIGSENRHRSIETIPHSPPVMHTGTGLTQKRL